MILFGKKAKNRSTETEEQKAARKQAEKEAAIAAYKEKRQLTLKRFFEIAGLPFPEKFEALADHPVSDFTADPRRLTPDSVFMYWQVGPLSSGYAEDPLERAVSTGCLCIITNEPCDFENSLLITDTNEDGYSIITNAYIRASHYIRSIHKSKVIALTGSVGKTSTKEMIEAVLRAHYKNPLVSKGNNNSMFSITRNIQKLKRPTNVYLQEVGAFAPRTIEISAKQLEADMAVYTNIGVSHVESYGSREELAKDKLSLSTYGKPDGLAFVNYDDEILMSHPFTQKVITYSLRNEEADYYAKTSKKPRKPDFVSQSLISCPARNTMPKFSFRESTMCSMPLSPTRSAGLLTLSRKKFSQASRNTGLPVCARTSFILAGTTFLRTATTVLFWQSKTPLPQWTTFLLQTAADA